MSVSSPIRVAVVNDYQLVVAGLAALLSPYAERVRVVELEAGMPIVSNVDVVLYDTFGTIQADGLDIEALLGDTGAHCVVFSWNLQPQTVQRALDNGASGYVSKEAGAQELVLALEAVMRGERVVSGPAVTESQSPTTGDWPGRTQGLSAREAEVVALITQGLSNQEIADRSYLSINSIKTYIRTAYRKMGVERRSQAVAWGIKHGFEPDRVRVVE